MSAAIPALSFRAKLLLAMMLVVVGVTGATLYVSQKKFQEQVREMFTELFERESDALARVQRALLENIQQACNRLVASSRVQLALPEAMDGETESLYRQVKGELEARQMYDVDSAVSNAVRATFFLLLDPKGRILNPPDSDSHLRRLAVQSGLTNQLAHIGKALAGMKKQFIGYITPDGPDGRPQLQQAVFTKIIDTVTGELLGALALGFPIPDLGQTGQGQYKIKAGILFEGRLYSRSVPSEKRDALARRITEQTRHSEHAPEDFIEVIDGEPHRIFYQTLNPDPHFPAAYLVALLSNQKAIEAQRDLRARIFFFGGLGLAGALAVSLALSHGLSVPIRELVAGTVEIQRGHFEVKVPVRSRDEIGRLAGAFNEMAQGLALKEKYRSVLDKVSDKAVADELVRGTVALGGETREVSVLFCDIRGFTALTQGMDPDEVIRMLNEHFTPLTQVVNQYHGVVDKFVGDLIMAIFGAPKSYGDDAHHAAHCAVEMIRTRQRLNETSRYQIQIGIGLATGPAVAGCMGSADRLNYTVLGERVNLASRLCGQAGKMEIVIDQATHHRLHDWIRVEPMPELLLKGFSERVSAYKLLEVQSQPEAV